MGVSAAAQSQRPALRQRQGNSAARRKPRLVALVMAAHGVSALGAAPLETTHHAM